MVVTAVITLNKYAWELDFDEEANVIEHAKYLATLEVAIPEKLRKAIGPYASVLGLETALTRIPDAQWFQELLAGHKFSVRMVKGNSNDTGNTDGNGQSGGTIHSRSAVPNESGHGPASETLKGRTISISSQGRNESQKGKATSGRESPEEN